MEVMMCPSSIWLKPYSMKEKSIPMIQRITNPPFVMLCGSLTQAQWASYKYIILEMKQDLQFFFEKTIYRVSKTYMSYP